MTTLAGRAERNSEAYSEARFTHSRCSDGPSNFRLQATAGGDRALRELGPLPPAAPEPRR